MRRKVFFQHLTAYVEGSQLPQKIESAHPLLVHSVSVDPPVQPLEPLTTRCAFLSAVHRHGVNTAYLPIGSNIKVSRISIDTARRRIV